MAKLAPARMPTSADLPRLGDTVLYHFADGPRQCVAPAVVTHAADPADGDLRLCLNVFGLHGPMAKLFVRRGVAGGHDVWTPRG